MRLPKNENPAIRALGIPSMSKFTKKLPSRNWLIFFGVVGSAIGGYFYDQNEIKKLRLSYMSEASRLMHDINAAREAKDVDINNIPTNLKLRKLKVIIAPLPDDYLDNTMKVWRRYIKPVIHAAGLDYSLVLGDEQGKIREQIANELREYKRKMIPDEDVPPPMVINQIETLNENEDKVDPLVEEILNKTYDFSNVLGVFYKNQDLKDKSVIYQDALQKDDSKVGGVLLEKTEYCTNYLKTKEDAWRENQKKLYPDKPVDELSMPDFIKTNFIGDKLDDTKQFEYPPKELVECQFKDLDTGINIFYKQPILLIPQDVLYGVKNWPWRIYNFFHQRYKADEYFRKTLSLIKQEAVNVQSTKDLDLLGRDIEENNWPSSWVKKGVEKGSEWVKPIDIDQRIVEDLKLYDTSTVESLYK
ncbi:unnamed protein product [Hanseniaspora opuntiae]